MERRLTTILAADLAGYSRLMAADEEGVLSRLRAARGEVIDPAVGAGGGRIVKTMGDGLLIEFPSPVEAVRTALSVQNRMTEREAGSAPDQRLRFRIGVHLGDVVVDGDDLLGDVVNVAARLETLAPVGGLCVSRAVREHIDGRVGARLTPLGPQMVKNMPAPIDVWRVEVEGADAASASSGRTEQPSLAVMPFENLSADADQAFLADGITEDVTNELSRFRSLTVISRASAAAIQGAKRSAAENGRELGARYLVQGAVRRAGDRVRVTAQLVDAPSGRQLWSGRWDRTVEDIFDLQDELTAAIIGEVEPELGAHERELSRMKPTESLTAWELCQRGNSELLAYRAEAYRRAIPLLQKSCEADPNFAMPHAILARTLWNIVSLGHSEDVMADVAQGLVHAQRAIEIDARLDFAYFPLGTLLAVAGRHDEAQSAIERGLSLNPNLAVLHHARAITSLWGPNPDPDLIVSAERRALKLSPKDPFAWGFRFMVAGGLFYGDWRHDASGATKEIDEARLYPNADWLAHLFAAASHAGEGRLAEAKVRLETALTLFPNLTKEHLRNAYTWPKWPLFFSKLEPSLDVLIELGLPRE